MDLPGVVMTLAGTAGGWIVGLTLPFLARKFVFRRSLATGQAIWYALLLTVPYSIVVLGLQALLRESVRGFWFVSAPGWGIVWYVGFRVLRAGHRDRGALREVTLGRPATPSGPSWAGTVLPIVLIVWGFVGAYLLQLAIDRGGENRMREKAIAEMAYFPSGRFLRGGSIEYQSLAADFIWLRGIQYYARHLMSDRKYEWLGHVFDILVSLDPGFIGAYHFGAITLAWDAGKPHEAVDFLTRGMKANPMSWQIPFDAGFICYMLLRDYGRASAFFEVASKMPNAWFILTRWAAVAKTKAGDFQTARAMWLDILKSTENRKLKELVVRQLTNLKLEETTVLLQVAVRKFHEDKKRLPADSKEHPFYEELLDAGYIDRIPEEPFGGRFYLKDGKVLTTTPPSQRE